MRKVTSSPVEIVPLVHLNDTNSRKFYGIIYQGGIKYLSKAYLTQKAYESNKDFYFACVEAANVGNTAYSIYNSHEEALKNVMDKGVEVLEFDTAQELFTWLGK